MYKLLGVIGIAFASMMFGMQIEEWRNTEKEFKKTKALESEKKILQDKVNDLSARSAKQNAEKQSLKTKLNEALSNERIKVIYRECVVPDSGVQLYNRAAQGLTATSP